MILSFQNLFYSLINIIFLICYANGSAMKLDSSNFDNVIGNNEIVFINFYASWCHFSNKLEPEWDKFAAEIQKIHPESKVVIGKLDSETEKTIAARFHVTKYPTIRLLRNGQPDKREYRGQRSVDAFMDHLKEVMKDPIKKLDSLDGIKDAEKNKRIIIGYFDKEDSDQYQVFKRVASHLKNDCLFYAIFGDASAPMRPNRSENIVSFKSSVTEEEETFRMNLDVFDEISIWATERCIPAVRMITFENAEELTEEGLPFLILFHAPDDTDIVKRFTKFIQDNLAGEKQKINFLHADGKAFAHPLHHLGKSDKDLPLIAIDSFRHMYLFKDISEMEVPGKLKNFVESLYNGKLHREFHYGPDPDSDNDDDEGDEDGNGTKKQDLTTPPESQFKNLAPSKNRYSLLPKDEF